MAEKMTRRTFMKSAAAAAAAISLSGVLVGCGGSGQLARRRGAQIGRLHRCRCMVLEVECRWHRFSGAEARAAITGDGETAL